MRLTRPNYPTIDRFENGVATSIKSIDLDAKTYQNMSKLSSKLKSYIDKVAAFNGYKRWDGVLIEKQDIQKRALDLAVPAGSATATQRSTLEAAVKYGQSVGVDVRIVEL